MSAALPTTDSTSASPTTLLYCVWEITLRCDLACNHCGSRAGKARADELSTAEALDVVSQLADMGCRELTLIGGEAYLRPDWTDIARASADAGIVTTMTTGGRGLTPERAVAAAEAGVQSVSVSIDGMRETHDTLRGVKGSWDAAVEAVQNVRAAGLWCSVNTQVNKLNLDQLDELLDLLIEWGCFAWQVQFTVAMGRAADNWEWLFQPDDVLVAVPKVAELKLRAREAGIKLYPGSNVGYFGPHETTLRGDVFSRGHTGGCTAGHQTLGLEADGKIKGCPSLPSASYTAGNLRDSRLRDVWDGAERMRFARERTVELWGFCASCYYKDSCMAGCTWTAHVLFGKPGNNPLCHHRALEHARQGKRERLVRVEAPPGEAFDHGRFELILEDVPTAPRTLPLAARPPVQ